MYRNELTTSEGKKIVYCIEEPTKNMTITNSSINFMIYSQVSIYEEIVHRLIDTAKLGDAKTIIQVYDNDMECHDETIFKYKKTSLGEILDIVSEESDTEDAGYLASTKIYLLSDFLEYDYKDRSNFMIKVFNPPFENIIKEKNILFIIPFKVNKMPASFKEETFDKDEFEDYNIAVDLMEEFSGTLSKFHFLFGFKEIIDSVTI